MGPGRGRGVLLPSRGKCDPGHSLFKAWIIAEMSIPNIQVSNGSAVVASLDEPRETDARSVRPEWWNSSRAAKKSG